MLSGTTDPEAHAAGAPELVRLDAEPVQLGDVTVFQLLCEIKSATAAGMLPPALHPTIPGVVTWLAYDCKDSPWGPFRLAQTRIECRSGNRPRGFLISGVIDNADAARELAAGWGYRLRVGKIELRRGYDGADLRVYLDDHYVLALGLRDPVLLPSDVVQFVSSMHPARTSTGYRLAQCDPKHEVSRAERGDPIVELFDAAAWGEDRLEPSYPLSAAICQAEVTLPQLRYLCRPGELAFTGTEPIER